MTKNTYTLTFKGCSVYPGFTTNWLIAAARSNDLEDVKAYLTKEININDSDNAGCTALDYAIQHSNQKMVIMLMNQGADLKGYSFKDSDEIAHLLQDAEGLHANLVSYIKEKEPVAIVRQALEEIGIDTFNTSYGF